MKKFILSLSFILLVFVGNTQRIFDFKIKNAENNSERTLMLDILRAKLYENHRQEFIFVVKHFKIGNNYGWLMADVQRKDGKKVKMPDEGDAWGCCHIEVLFKKSGSKWYVVESVEFSTDVWWQGISNKYPSAPKAIFDDLGRN
jgi:hypothetical protein